MTIEQFQEEQSVLAGIVREAMAYGPDPALAGRYREQRAAIQAHYGELRPIFDRVWTTSDDPRRFREQNTDPIESLLGSPTLDRLLRRDPKHIERDLQDIQTAFELCRGPEEPVA
ncbi:MAG: hypothetical protein JSS66_09710 [Armatimonadetes bacterium]|nr:hypothetical protein [Armatimonadota bacterium]